MSESRKLSPQEALYLRTMLREKAYRLMRPTAIYEPIPQQKRFHQSQAPERLAVGANRGAKTTACVMELAYAVTGTHPWLDYPKTNGIAICVAQNADKIGTIMYRKLFMREAFWMIKDKKTDTFRAWRPWEDGHYDFKGLTRCLPPIDRRMLDTTKGTQGIAWERRGHNIPRTVYLRNGWEIRFFSSDGEPPRGIDVDLVWMDEECVNEQWYAELSARLIDRRGRFMWSATPQSATDQLWRLHERALKEQTDPFPKIEEFTFLLDDNPFLDPRAKEDFKLKFANNPEEYEVRVLGKFKVQSERVYPTFSRIHLCEPFVIPDHWCRYLAIDPGYSTSAILFIACPPSTLPQHAYVYDEYYAKQKDVNAIAAELRAKVGGQAFEAFLIDDHGGRRTETLGKSVAYQWQEAFKKEGIASISTGSGFIHCGEDGYAGHSPKNAGMEQVREWLWPRGELGGKPKLQVFEALCPNFVREMSHYRYKKVAGKLTNKTEADSSHGPDCLRYAVTYGIQHVQPVKKPRKHSLLEQKLLRERAEKHQGEFIALA